MNILNQQITPTAPITQYILNITQDTYFDLKSLVSWSYPHIFINGLELYNDEFKEDFLQTYEQSIIISHHMYLLKKAYKPDCIKGKCGFVCVPIFT